MNINGIINSPQFDTKYFKVGIPIKVEPKGRTMYYALVLESTAFKLRIVFCIIDEDGAEDYATTSIMLKEVIDGKVKVTSLVNLPPLVSEEEVPQNVDFSF